MQATETQHLFEARVRACTACIAGPCALDVRPDNVLRCSGFSSEAAARRELALVYDYHRLQSILKPCEDIGLREAFVVRNELVNFKKQCLTVFQNHQRTDVLLRRFSSLYFCDVVNTGASDPERALYTRLSGATMQCKGRMKAVLDLREMGKYICQTPRHPGLDCSDFPEELKSMPLSTGLHQMLDRVQSFLSTVTEYHPEPTPVAATPEAFPLPEEGNALFDTLINSIAQHNEDMRPYELEYVRKCLIARGCHKALRIRLALSRWLGHLRGMLARTEEFLSHFTEFSEFCFELKSLPCNVDENRIVRHEMHCNMHACLLVGALPVLRYAVEAITAILLAPDVRMFSAGDAGFRSTASVSVPDISIVPQNILRCIREASTGRVCSVVERLNRLRCSTQKSTFTCLRCGESFPKLWVSFGLMTGPICVCMSCEMRCRELGLCPWGNYCDVGSEVKLSVDTGKSKACPGPSLWCTHQSVCLACDDSVDGCLQCLFVKGDGESVMLLADQFQGSLRHIFIDFDGTMASTKKGENPMGSLSDVLSKSKVKKRSQSHSIDANLRELCSMRYDNRSRDKIEVHIVTRNTHKEDIVTFLRKEGCDVDLHGIQVHIVGRRLGTNKVDVIKATVENSLETCSTTLISRGHVPQLSNSIPPPPVALFIDDTLAEHLDFPLGVIEGTSHRILRVHFGCTL